MRRVCVTCTSAYESLLQVGSLCCWYAVLISTRVGTKDAGWQGAAVLLWQMMMFFVVEPDDTDSKWARLGEFERTWVRIGGSGLRKDLPKVLVP